jgi:CheY-like chemotaxis protein/anti-sigma regulatory factor (Ser/Thr protein kinase)
MSHHLLIVDDEPLNLEILSEYFDGQGYRLTMAESGEEAWRLLQQNDAFDLILLDRMMPGMDGVELLRQIKATPAFKKVPVIMQTAASAPEQVREGLLAGALYYLTKPYERDSLLAIVRAALSDGETRQDLQERLREHANALRLMANARFTLSTLDEVGCLAAFLAQACPQPEAAVLGLSELLVNAIEHGNLGISYAEKSRLKRSDQWQEEILRRLALPENRDKVVEVEFRRQDDLVRICIRDQGEGFDWSRYLDFDPARAFDPNGRGIAMARLGSLNNLEFIGNGNTVIATLSALAS